MSQMLDTLKKNPWMFIHHIYNYIKISYFICSALYSNYNSSLIFAPPPPNFLNAPHRVTVLTVSYVLELQYTNFVVGLL